MRSERKSEAGFMFVAAASIVAVAVAVAGLAACGGGGGGGSKPATRPAGAASASASASGAGSGFAVTPPPSGLPPLASMPAPGVTGSKKAKKKTDGALYACGGGTKPSAKDPAELVKRVGEACAGAAKMKPVGPMMRAQQADRDAHQEHKLRVEPNKCYRVVFATDENVKDAVIVMRDSAGDMVAESAGAALPEDGAICFSVADEITLMIAVGAGKGAYAAQVWSD
jgi:hypothetical protein